MPIFMDEDGRGRDCYDAKKEVRNGPDEVDRVVDGGVVAHEKTQVDLKSSIDLRRCWLTLQP